VVKACFVAALAATVSLVGAIATLRAQDTKESLLRVCLDEELPPFSVRTKDGGSGFDFAIAQSLAKRLNRTLAVQWYESKLDEDASATIEANALLSDGRCDLVAGYPLVKDALGKPGLETGRLPDFAGARPADRRRRVTLGTLMATTPYHFAGLAVVLGARAKDQNIAVLSDLEGFDLIIEAGTLGDAVLMTFNHGRLVSHITHVVPGRGELFPRLESGEADATLIPMHRFDAYRLQHPDTKLTLSGYYLPIGFNMGFVGLSSDSQLIEQASAAIDAMLQGGEPAGLAAHAHMTYLPPRQPYILDHFTMSDLTR
jgi:ABC-type amino acid transport substrate-binding protein